MQNRKKYIDLMCEPDFDYSGLRITDENTGKQLEFSVEEGELILPRGRRKPMRYFTIRMPQEDFQRIKQTAEKKKTTYSNFTRTVLNRAVQEAEEHEDA